MYDAALHHQWELEQQEMLEMEQDFKDFDEYQTKRDQLTGRLLGAIDMLKVAEQTWSPARKNAAIADILYYNDELDKLKKQFWGEK